MHHLFLCLGYRTWCLIHGWDLCVACCCKHNAQRQYCSAANGAATLHKTPQPAALVSGCDAGPPLIGFNNSLCQKCRLLCWRMLSRWCSGRQDELMRSCKAAKWRSDWLCTKLQHMNQQQGLEVMILLRRPSNSLQRFPSPSGCTLAWMISRMMLKVLAV